MDIQTIIKQLRKALECKDDKELRLRIEVVTDMLEETSKPLVLPPQPAQPTQPLQPTQPRYEQPAQPGTYRSPRAKGPSGPGAIVGGEQITYRRPAGT